MTGDERDVTDQAIGWHLRQDTMDADDWRVFVAWLGEDAAHADAYDRIVLDDSLLDLRDDRWAAASSAAPAAANDRHPPKPPRRRWRWLAAGGMAAAAAAAYLLPFTGSAGAPYEVSTRPGQRQELALADGTRIELSGGTTLALDRARPRTAELRQGEATFHVRHDESDPFTLTAGGMTIRDMGTVFNVAHADRRLSIEVAEGSVLFQPDREAVTLRPGSALTTVAGSDRVMLSRVAVGTIGGWREGRVSFAGTPLAQVVGAVERQVGVDITLASTFAARPFTGMIRLTGVAERDVPHVAALIGARARQDRRGWVIEPLEFDGR